ncbi:hypothetical protein POTOM_014611 [Populus tomentosa]|uniref:Uncharacterized protein n=1 Tax=Populus tomentosa TaxID=118781 RepID=A0A8X8DA93_POPTO|nr:hypothetical protein POTOM_014611 [Populus tomentosa]
MLKTLNNCHKELSVSDFEVVDMRVEKMKTLMAESGESNGRYSTVLNFNYIQHSEAHRGEIRMKQWTIGLTAHKAQL